MIGLMDCNNFFVSCERLFRPDLEGKPVAVLSGVDGCIVARSNEVKAMGVPMGMPLFQAKQLVNMESVQYFTSNFALYRDISKRVMDVLIAEVGEAQVYSVDEAFFAVADTATVDDVHRIRTVVMQQVGIPVTIGVAATKTLAKVASGYGKKGDGVCLLDAATWQQRAAEYPVGDVWNIGRATAQRLRSQSVRTAADFMQLDRAVVAKQYGVSGCRVYDELHGVAVHTIAIGETKEAGRQSIMSTRSFTKSTTKRSELESALAGHVAQVAENLRQKQLVAGTMQVTARASRHGDFAHRTGTAEVSLAVPTADTATLLKAAMSGLDDLYSPEVPYKKVGIVVSGLLPVSYVQPSLFRDEAQSEPVANQSVLGALQDQLNAKFGRNTIQYGTQAQSAPRYDRSLRSPAYTTRWGDIPTVSAKKQP